MKTKGKYNRKRRDPHIHYDDYYKKWKITRIGKDVEKVEHLCTMGRIVKWCTSMKNNMSVPPQIKTWTTLWLSNPTFGYISKRTENRLSERYLHTRIYSSTFLNSQKVEATQKATDGWMDEQNMVYGCDGILFSLKKDVNPITFYNTDVPWGCNTKWNKWVTKR